jgi:hypothetical protein
LKADNIITVVDMDNIPLVISHRLSPSNTPPMEKVVSSHLTLQEILIVGNCSDQVLIAILYIFLLIITIIIKYLLIIRSNSVN